MRRLLAVVVLLPSLPLAARVADNEKEVDRVRQSTRVLHEIIDIPDNMVNDAQCVIILPSRSGIGGTYGRGLILCRSGEHFTGPWMAPAMYAIEEINTGFQLGGHRD